MAYYRVYYRKYRKDNGKPGRMVFHKNYENETPISIKNLIKTDFTEYKVISLWEFVGRTPHLREKFEDNY